MAEYTSRDVTTVRREYVLRAPTNWVEIGKVCNAIQKELDIQGISASDDRVTVEPRDNEIVFWYEKSSEATHG